MWKQNPLKFKSMNSGCRWFWVQVLVLCCANLSSESSFRLHVLICETGWQYLYHRIIVKIK
jgi:hypothetical protein